MNGMPQQRVRAVSYGNNIMGLSHLGGGSVIRFFLATGILIALSPKMINNG